MESEQLLSIMDYVRLSGTFFANEINVPAATISNIKNGKAKASIDVIEKIHNRFPEISIEWMVLGKGEMLNKTTESGKKNSNNTHKQTNELPSLFDFDKLDSIQTDTGNSNEKPQNDINYTAKNIETKQNVYENKEDRRTSKIIEKIIVYYTDKTFDEFTLSDRE